MSGRAGASLVAGIVVVERLATIAVLGAVGVTWRAVGPRSGWATLCAESDARAAGFAPKRCLGQRPAVGSLGRS